MQIQINQVLSELRDSDVFSGAIIAVKDGDIIAHQAFGEANRSWNIPNTTETIFRIASITKFFTGVLTMKLAEDGLIDLAEPLLKYLPWYRSDIGARITIHQLLAHTSGLSHYPKATFGFMENEARRAHDPQEFAVNYCSNDLLSEPGERFYYSNDNYHLLGLIIEAVTEMTYIEALQKYVFGPAGITNTGMADHSTIIPRLSQGYDWKDDHYENAIFVEMSAPWAAGGLYGTVEDLAKFYIALENGALIKPESFDLICSPHTKKGDALVGYSCLLTHYTVKDVITVPGGLPGFDNAIWFHRKTKSFVGLLSNTWGRRPNGVQNKILKILIEQ